MSKVICDVCGTAYPETSSQCPICGCAKVSTAQTAAAGSGQPSAEGNTGYTYVKGGRFSKKNVRKRNRSGGKTPERRNTPARAAQRRNNDEGEEKTSVALIVVVIFLLVAIIAVVGYILIQYYGPSTQANRDNNSGTSQTQPKDPNSGTTDGTTPSDPNDTIPCTQIALSSKTIELTAVGDTENITVMLTPQDTTDIVEFTSSDPAVVTVSENGVVTAVGAGEAVITVKCGDISDECRVVCSFGGTDTPVIDPTDGFEFTFNTYNGEPDATFSEYGYVWKAYKSSMPYDPKELTWISDDPAVCTIEDGVVTAVGPGTTQIHVQYNGITYSCTIRCKFEVPADTTDGCVISSTDVSISIGEKFTLTLKDVDGNVLSVEWTADKSGYVSIDGNSITGSATGTVNVSCTYEDVTYTCIVRVK